MNDANSDELYDDGWLGIYDAEWRAKEEAEAVSGYPVTRDELLLLARHWYETHLDLALFQFMYQQYASQDFGIMQYAMRRIDRIAKIVGEDAVREVLDEVKSEERKKLGDETWRIFTEGSEAEQEGVRVRIHRTGEYLDAKREDEETCSAAFTFLAGHPGDIYIDAAGDLWHLAEAPPGPAQDASQLVLAVHTRSGGSTHSRDYRVPRPKGWFPPFGLK